MEDWIPRLLLLAWLLPLGSFVAILLFGPRMGKAGRSAGYVATGAIATGFLLSLVAMIWWLCVNPVSKADHAPTDAAEGQPAESGHGETAEPAHGESDEHHEVERPEALHGEWYALWEEEPGQPGGLKISIGYYIDGLTLAMFCMVTLVASCIHVYSFGYMHEELEDVTDPLVTTSDGKPFLRPGRYHRFFQYFSLFCFSMLGLVVAGNVAMVFVFWELVGICSYLLIGFYRERKSASTAGNKAFIVNRVGDFGMIIGLMAIWGGLGTFAFDEIFALVRPEGVDHKHALIAPDGMTYGLLVIAGLGIFCGCVGKSAQFPLHVWLPDAMEGPTPVSALIHAATMVAAGVYLVGRFFPVFTPEVLLVIAIVGCITLFIAATIAIVATDIKRVLAYSTVSQLGYMMLALGVGGWVAGLLHLFTHAFFKALLFLCSGSVIHACHTNEMPEMGGLRKKMPWTAGTMLVGCLAIAGAGLPLSVIGLHGWDVGLSGFHSKDSVIAQVFSFQHFGLLFWMATIGAVITAFYMFRMWYMTFAGKPRNEHVYEHAHESPKVMYVPLVILAVFAVIAAWEIPFTDVGLVNVLEQARPAGTEFKTASGSLWSTVQMPAEHDSHEPEVHVLVSAICITAALLGFFLATAFYGKRWISAETVRKAVAPVHSFLVHKWWFDELYDWVFVRPVLAISAAAAWIDRNVIDWLADNSARFVQGLSQLDDWIDRTFVDRLVDLIAAGTYWVGLRLRAVQTGWLRQYVMYIAVGTVALFILATILWR